MTETYHRYWWWLRWDFCSNSNGTKWLFGSLYEQNNHIGGKVNRHESDGFGFDLGPSILTMPYIFEKLFEYSKKQMSDYVTIKRLPHQWRSFFQMERLSICMKVLKKQVSIMRYCRNRI